MSVSFTKKLNDTSKKLSFKKMVEENMVAGDIAVPNVAPVTKKKCCGKCKKSKKSKRRKKKS